jgi:hypothetical protein
VPVVSEKTDKGSDEGVWAQLEQKLDRKGLMNLPCGLFVKVH